MNGKEKSFSAKISLAAQKNSSRHRLFQGGIALEGIDQDLQARVWSRVSERSELPPLPELPGRLSPLTGELAANYRYLGQRIPACRDLERNLLQNQNQIFSLQALRGIREERKNHASPRGDPKTVLERCCHLERRLASGLDACRGDPEWGEVFGVLAQQARQRCLSVLGLWGKMG